MRDFETNFAGEATVKSKYGLQIIEPYDVLLASFEVHQTPYLNNKIAPCTFYEGLWKYDCGEVWLYSPSTGRYLEINLAPNGAWWACVFSGVRQRDVNCISPICEPSSVETQDSWFVTIKISLFDIERCLGSLSDLRANVTLVLGGCPDGNIPPENLHTIAPLSAMDFHLPDQWLPINSLLTESGANAV